MNIAILSTSPRKHSNSLKVARIFKSLLSEGEHEITITDFEDADIPMVGRGHLDPMKLSVFQTELIARWESAQIVIFIVPEYNWITGGEIINVLHQLGSQEFSHLFDNKVFAFAGVSSGRGGRRPCLEIGVLVNKLISFLHKHSVVSPKLFESHDTGSNLDDNGVPTGNERYEKSATSFLTYTLDIAAKWRF